MHHHTHTSRLARAARTSRVAVKVLGGFEVSVDGAVTPAGGWARRPAAALVKVLALAPGHRLHREHVMDILWPDDPPDATAPKLHKAAHYARRASGRNDAIVLRNDVVALFPSAELTVDAMVFDELSRRAIDHRDTITARAAIGRYPGELLPDDRYEEWAGERREVLRLRHVNLLRLTGQWMAVTEHDPGDEQAHVELMRDHVANGDGGAALLQYERLERVLDRNLGVTPGSAARALREHIRVRIGTAPTVRPGRSPQITGVPSGPPARNRRLVEDLVSELAELTRRQASLLEALTAARSFDLPLTTLGAAS